MQKALKKINVGADLDSTRGWDHGLWVPLRLMFPEARLPVVELSLPMGWAPEKLFQVGQALRDLRKDGILVMGSGGVVHNLSLFRGGPREAPVEPWAKAFDGWVADAVERQDHDSLFAYQRLAPNASLAVPTPEHFAPLFVVLGAAHPYSHVVSIFEGFEYSHISMRCFALE